jgi:hypothetical protein
MPAFIDGLIAVGVLLFIARAWSLAGSNGVAKGQRLSFGIMVALAAIALFMMREIGLAVVAASAAWFLLFGAGPQQSAQSRGRGRDSSSDRGSRNAPAAGMSRAEAFSVLGLQEGASNEAIRAAHRRLMQQIHPDKGGSNYLAAKINQAKDVLLGR